MQSSQPTLRNFLLCCTALLIALAPAPAQNLPSLSQQARSTAFRSEPALAGQPVTSVVQTKDGALWIGTHDDGLRRIRNGVLNHPIPATALTSAVILCMAPAANGGLWVGTPDGLNYIGKSNAVQRITSADGLPDDYIRALAVDADGSVWVGTRKGLAHLHGVGKQLKPDTLTHADGLGSDLIGSLLLTPDGLWVATSGGLSLVRGNSKIRNLTTNDGLGANIVTAMVQDRTGHLWAATSDGGLSYFNGRRFYPAGTFPQDFGSGGNIEGITQDRQGSLWLRMDRGIRRLALTALQKCVGEPHCAPPDGTTARYGMADGLPNDEVVAGEPSEGWLTSNGELWFPTHGGVAIVDTEHLPSNTVAPPVAVQRFQVDDISEPIGAASLNIPFGHARFTMEYTGLSFTAPSAVRYRFRLEGFDKDWVEAGNRSSATYTNLTPGSYVFRAQAMNDDGVWSTGAELRFRIIPPIYRRWWFIVMVLLVVLAALAGMRLRAGFASEQRPSDAHAAER
jgi:ligand-binding sensor domain-containing protein